MIRRLQRGSHFANIVYDTAEEPEERNPMCSTCAAVGVSIQNELQRLYLDMLRENHCTVLPPDADQFLQLLEMW